MFKNTYVRQVYSVRQVAPPEYSYARRQRVPHGCSMLFLVLCIFYVLLCCVFAVSILCVCYVGSPRRTSRRAAWARRPARASGRPRPPMSFAVVSDVNLFILCWLCMLSYLFVMLMFFRPPLSFRAAPNVRLPRTSHCCGCRVRRGNSQRLAKSSLCAGPSAGTEVARFRKWHFWCLLGQCALYNNIILVMIMLRSNHTNYTTTNNNNHNNNDNHNNNNNNIVINSHINSS